MIGAGGSHGRYNGHDKHGSDEVAGSLYAGSENPAGTSWKDGSGGTSDEFSTNSIEVVKPHSWPVYAKIAKTRLGEREPTQTDALAGGREPTQA